MKRLLATIALIALLPLALLLQSADTPSTSAEWRLPDLPFFDAGDYTIAEGGLGECTLCVRSTLPVVPADGETEATLTLTLTDAGGEPVPDHLLALLFNDGDGQLMPESPLTDSSGEATFLYRAGRLAILNQLVVLDTATGATFEFDLPTSLSAVLTVELVSPAEYEARKAASATRPDIFDLTLTAIPDVLPADMVSSSRLTAHLTYKDGRPAAGFPIVFRIASGYGSIVQDAKLTDRDGFIEAFYQVSDRVGTVLIEAVEQTTGARASVEITVVRAGPAKLQLFFDDAGILSDEPALMPADGASCLSLVARVLSLADTPIAGVKVRFKLKEELGRIEVFDEVSDAAGEVHAAFVAGTFTGVEEITAFIISELPASE